MNIPTTTECKRAFLILEMISQARFPQLKQLELDFPAYRGFVCERMAQLSPPCTSFGIFRKTGRS